MVKNNQYYINKPANFIMLTKTALSKIKRSDNLPKLPQVILNLIEACNKNETSTTELIEIISADPGLTARLMSIMGSAHININREIKSIETAVVYLGINTIRNLAISMAMMQVFDAPKKIPEWNMNAFWYHSFSCAIISRKIAERTGDVNPEEAFLAGLMHDIGAMLLFSTFPEEYASILAGYETEKDIIEAEKEKFKMSRFEAGAWLCSQWDLNPLVCDAILYVNETKESIASALPLVRIVFAASRLADFDPDDTGEELLIMAGMDQDEAEQLFVDAEEEVSVQARNLGIKKPLLNHKASPSISEDIFRQLTEDSLKLKVKGASFIYGTIENLLYAGTEQEILNAVDTGIKILFGAQRLFCFLHDEERQLLIGRAHPDDRKKTIINSIAVPFTNGKSLLIKSLVDRSAVNSINLDMQEQAAISDSQILRLMETKEMFCFPMLAGKKPLGVIIIGVSEDCAQDMIRHSSVIEMISQLAAVCLDNIGYRKSRSTDMQNERVRAASETTRSIIHEINNPLGIIDNYLNILSLKLPNKHPAQNELKVINEEIDRIATLLTQLSDCAAPLKDKIESVDINALFTSILEILKKTMLVPRGIEAVFNPDMNLPPIKTCKNGVKQIFINLLKNASEAMEQGGRIDIITRRISGSEKIMIDEKRKIPGRLEIIIKDNGPGIPDNINSRLFEPCNSSKKTGHSGLGLSIVKNIVNRINGKIECKTAPGRGTVFRIILPVS